MLAVLYLAFNAGYSDVAFTDVATSAVSLTEAVVDLMPRVRSTRPAGADADPEVAAERRFSSAGELLTLEEQDRALWNRADIDRGRAMLASARERGPYVLQALIALCHAGASSAESTDWARIVALYDELLLLSPSPIVSLNRAIAVGMRDGPDAGLALLDDLNMQLAGFRLMPAAQADLLRRAGRLQDAAARYREAIPLAATAEESAQLRRRLAQLTAE